MSGKRNVTRPRYVKLGKTVTSKTEQNSLKSTAKLSKSVSVKRPRNFFRTRNKRTRNLNSNVSVRARAIHASRHFGTIFLTFSPSPHWEVVLVCL